MFFAVKILIEFLTTYEHLIKVTFKGNFYLPNRQEMAAPEQNTPSSGDVLTTDAKNLMCEKLLASEELEQKTPTAYNQFVSPRTITGPAQQISVTKGTIDW